MLRRILPALAVLAAAGCGTLTNQSEFNWTRCGEPHTSNRAYGGVLVDAQIADDHFGRALRDPDFNPPLEGHAAALAYLLLDMPLSFVADTVLLPYDLWITATGRAIVNPGISDYHGRRD